MRTFLIPAATIVALGAVTAPAHANTPVVIEGVSDDMRAAIRALLPDRERPTTLFEAERIAEEAAARANAYLRSEGYYAADVRPEATEEPASSKLIITLGTRFRFAAPNLAFVGDEPIETAQRAAQEELRRIEPNEPARTADVLSAESAAVAALQNRGYADAAAQTRRVVVDHATSDVTANINLNAGDYVRLGVLRADPDTVLRADYVPRLQNWEEGETYTPARLAAVRRDILGTSAVSRATTRLEPPNAEGLRDVVLELEPAKRNAYEFGAGYSTTEGLGLDAEWTRRNYTRRADSLTVAATLAELNQSLSAELARPHAAGLNRTRRYGVEISREDNDAFTRSGVAISTSVDADAQRLAYGLSYGAELSADSFEDTSGGVSDAIVLTTFADLRNDTRDFRFDARDGSLVELRVEPSLSTGDASLAFVRATAEGRVYESFTENDALTLAARAKLGWLEPLAGNADDVPPDRRFYAGGGGSVRGYEYNSIYPLERDLLGLPPGGQGAFEASVEARYRFAERFGVVGFIDGGNAFDDLAEAGDLHWGVGAGFRYDLGFAPLRVDIAVPLDPREQDPDYALYISIGQAF